MTITDRIKVLEEEIEALMQQWPAHSVPAAMLLRLDALEDELEVTVKEMKEAQAQASHTASTYLVDEGAT
jgi:hypothetical protein